MWIDAICINQADKEEKPHQVGMMGEIFQACDEAVLWLGEDPDLVESAQPPPPSRIPRPAFEAFALMGANKHASEIEFCTLNEEGELVTAPKYEDHLKALGTLLTRPWWKRIWIVQEALLPIKAVFVYGSESALFDIMRMELMSFWQHSESCCSESWAALILDHDDMNSIFITI